MTILFLGNSYSRFTVMCLVGLLRTNENVIVAYYDPTSRGIVRLLRESIRSRDARFVVSKAIALLHCKIRAILRRLRLPLKGAVSLEEVVLERGLNSIPCSNPNDSRFVSKVRSLGVDLIVVGGFSRILKRTLLDVPRLGVINVHPSLLPKYRGPDPVYWVLRNGESKSGVTLHCIDERIDSGDIISQRQICIVKGISERRLLANCADVAADLLAETIPLLASGEVQRIPQDDSVATYYSFRPKGNSHVR